MSTDDRQRVLDLIRSLDNVSALVKQVIVNRLTAPFTRDEIDRARYQMNKDWNGRD